MYQNLDHLLAKNHVMPQNSRFNHPSSAMRVAILLTRGTIIASLGFFAGTAVAKDYELSLWTQFSSPAVTSERVLKSEMTEFDALLLELGGLERELRVLERLSTEMSV